MSTSSQQPSAPSPSTSSSSSDSFKMQLWYAVSGEDRADKNPPPEETVKAIWSSVVIPGSRSAVTQILQFFNQAVASAFVARFVGIKELGSFAIAISFFNVTGVSYIVGAATAIETLAGNQFGGAEGNKMLAVAKTVCFVYLVLSCCCVVVVAFWYLSGPLGILDFIFGAELGPEIYAFLRMSPLYLLAFVARAALNRAFIITKRSDCMLRGMIVAVIAYPLYGFALIPNRGWGIDGIDGAVVSLTLSTVTHVLSMLAFGYYTNNPEDDTPSFVHHLSFSYFRDSSVMTMERLVQFARLAAPSAASLVISWWVTEAMVILGSRLPRSPADYVAALGVVNLVELILLVGPIGLNIAVASGIATRLGAGDWHGARSFAGVSNVICLIFSCGFAITILLFGHYFFLIYTSDAGVIGILDPLVPLLAVFHVAEAAQHTYAATFRGAGRQSVLMKVSSVVMWLFCVPLMIYAVRFKLLGLLAAFTIGLLTQLPILHYYSYGSFDWCELSKEAHERMEKEKKKPAAAPLEQKKEEEGETASSVAPSAAAAVVVKSQQDEEDGELKEVVAVPEVVPEGEKKGEPDVAVDK